MCAPAPPQPDYAGAAREQGAANLQAATTTSKLQNPNVISPYGTVTYGTGDAPSTIAALEKKVADLQGQLPSWDMSWVGRFPGDNQSERAAASFYETTSGLNQQIEAAQRELQQLRETGKSTADLDRPTMVQTFSPEQQRLYDLSVKAKTGLGELAGQGTEALKGVIGKGVDFTGIGTGEDTRKRVYDAMMGRVNEDYGRKRDDLNSQLIASGLRPGSKAYDDQMQLMERGLTDARQQAILGSDARAIEQRKNEIAEMLMQRQVPLNEITALLSGSQVSNPFAMPGYSQGQQVAPTMSPKSMQIGYDTDLYNMEATNAGNLRSGLFGLGGAGIMAMSDRRLKSNITRIGTHPLGIGLYEYDIMGRHEVGVMADEAMTVRPSAVRIHPSGYLMVDYGQIGGRF